MTTFHIGDKVRDISGHFTEIYDWPNPAVGVIVSRDHENGSWVIDWEGTDDGRINWHDSQIELVERQHNPIVMDALVACKEMAKTVEGMTGGRSDDEWIWGVQKKIDAAIAALLGK